MEDKRAAQLEKLHKRIAFTKELARPAPKSVEQISGLADVKNRLYRTKEELRMLKQLGISAVSLTTDRNV